MSETTHPHNETLQLIDAKCKRLIQTIDYISSMVKTDRKESETSIMELTNKINALSKTKDYLLHEENTIDFILQGNFYE